MCTYIYVYIYREREEEREREREIERRLEKGREMNIYREIDVPMSMCTHVYLYNIFAQTG